jgi:hypothetical protein
MAGIMFLGVCLFGWIWRRRALLTPPPTNAASGRLFLTPEITMADLSAFRGFKGPLKRLDDLDLPRIGHRIGVGEDEIHAVWDVEAASKASDASGRLPMLYEPHIAWRETKGAQRRRLADAGLAYAKWKKSYPKDSYPRLLKAIEIAGLKALRWCSWGSPQIMGFNHEAAGYATPEAMVLDFIEDEDNQLEAFIRFVIAKNLGDEIRDHRWQGFENGYNGGGQGGAYARKLEDAFKRWQRRPDTPWRVGQGEDAPAAGQGEPVAGMAGKPGIAAAPGLAGGHRAAPGMDPAEHTAQVDAGLTPTAAPVGSPPVPLPAEPVAPGLSGFMVKAAQQRLRDLGFFVVGIPNEDPGPRTVAAIAAFQKVAGLPVTSQFDQATLDRLGADDAPRAPISEERANTTESDLYGTSRIVTAAVKGKVEAGWKLLIGSAGIAGTALANSWDAAWEKAQAVNEATGGHGAVILIGGFALVLIIFALADYHRNHTIAVARVEDTATGKTA